MNITEKEYWEQRWQESRTGWDLGRISPPLQAYIDTIFDKNQRILIPGCGNAYEAEYLLQQGFTNITVMDIAPTLTQQLSAKLSAHIELGHLRVICGDFFELQETFDLILEQTFFCAINPSQRSQYAQQVHILLNPGGKLVGVLFNRPFEGGPPFGGNQQEYESYFTPLFQSVKMEPCYNSAAPRMGTELFIQLQY